uniref:Protein FRA10AC1 n=1 Tax=Triatoma infestans TaxID=30076 RepID=A0A023F7L7_TRIIF
MNYSHRYLSLNPYELHKHLINTYVLNRTGTTSLLRRDTSKDKTDIDVIRENHKFIWEDDEQPTTWEERLARKYYDKLFKEFCIADLSRYKENMFAMRWQTENELITGKGQFICGNKICPEKDDLKTWEVNFGYIEHGEKKNALVKLRLCDSCSKKLNYKHKRKEIKRLKRSKKFEPGESTTQSDGSTDKMQLETVFNETNPENISNDEQATTTTTEESEEDSSNIWKAPIEDTEESSRDEEFEKYLEHLLL